MKIAMVSHYFGSHRGGIEIVAEELFRQFAARGQEVVWLASDVTPAPEIIGHARTVALPVWNYVERKIGIPFPIPKLGALRELTRAVDEADVVVLQDCLYLSNIFSFLLTRAKGVPTIIIQHAQGSIPRSRPVLRTFTKLANMIVTRPMLSSAAQVVFIGGTTRNFFRNVRYRSRPEIVFNGVDGRVYRAPESPQDRMMLRHGFGLPEDRPTVLFVGRFVEIKGVRVLKHMAEMRPDWTWVFAGWGPLDPAKWNAPNVRVMSGLQGPTLSGLYQACDVLALPSVGEGFPLVIQEALASGLGVVCAAETLEADPAMGTFVRGVPIQPSDDEGTARRFLAAIEDLLRAGAEQTNLPRDRRTFAISRYSWAKGADRYLEIASRLAPRCGLPLFEAEPGTAEIQR